MASSLAAAIKNKFGITARLTEGHNGIYEVAVNGTVIYSNQGSCSQRPKEEEIFREIQKYCCGTQSNPISLEGTQDDRRYVNIEFMYLDLSVCTWCQSTESNLEEAISDVAHILKTTGVDVNVKKIHIQSEEQARELSFVSSPTIRINGQDIQLEVKEALCDSCGDLCGDTVDCRIWIYQGKEYTAPPKGMIIDAILREVYGGPKRTIENIAKTGEVPENLKRFFAAKRSKEDKEIEKIDSCYSSFVTSSDKCT